MFTITEAPSKIDALLPEEENKTRITVGKFLGKIEFKDVWFRYPTRKG